MSDQTIISFIGERFDRTDPKLDRVIDDLQDLKHRVTSLERRIGEARVDAAGVSAPLDRIETSRARLERRVDRVPAS